MQSSLRDDGTLAGPLNVFTTDGLCLYQGPLVVDFDVDLDIN